MDKIYMSGKDGDEGQDRDWIGDGQEEGGQICAK